MKKGDPSKKGDPKPMSMPTIVSGIVAAHDNARALVEEADLLRGHFHHARAFALAHFAREELAKIPLLMVAGVRLAKGVEVPWAHLRRRLTFHAPKWQVVVTELVHARQYLHEQPVERLRDELAVVAYIGGMALGNTFEDGNKSQDGAFVLKEWHAAVEQWGKRRETAIYVEESGDEFIAPMTRIYPATSMMCGFHASTGVRYYEPLLPIVPGFLEEPPDTAPMEDVFVLRTKMLQGGAGGVIDPSLLELDGGGARGARPTR